MQQCTQLSPRWRSGIARLIWHQNKFWRARYRCMQINHSGGETCSYTCGGRRVARAWFDISCTRMLARRSPPVLIFLAFKCRLESVPLKLPPPHLRSKNHHLFRAFSVMLQKLLNKERYCRADSRKPRRRNCAADCPGRYPAPVCGLRCASWTNLFVFAEPPISSVAAIIRHYLLQDRDGVSSNDVVERMLREICSERDDTKGE